MELLWVKAYITATRKIDFRLFLLWWAPLMYPANLGHIWERVFMKQGKAGANLVIPSLLLLSHTDMRYASISALSHAPILL